MSCTSKVWFRSKREACVSQAPVWPSGAGQTTCHLLHVCSQPSGHVREGPALLYISQLWALTRSEAEPWPRLGAQFIQALWRFKESTLSWLWCCQSQLFIPQIFARYFSCAAPVSMMLPRLTRGKGLLTWGLSNEFTRERHFAGKVVMSRENNKNQRCGSERDKWFPQWRNGRGIE